MTETNYKSDIGAGLRCSSAASLPECGSSRQNRGRKRESVVGLRSERRDNQKEREEGEKVRKG